MRRATWILWLMLALLPLRSWAVAGMGLPQALPDRVEAVVMTHDADAPAAAAMPCHEGGAQAEGSSTCESCDWCHAALGTAPEGVVPGKPPIAEAPFVAPQRDTGRPPVGGLERPPRNLLA